MMQGHEKATYKDKLGVNDVEMEVNWNENTGEDIRITIGDKVAVISYDDLYGFILLNSTGEKFSQIAPAQKTLVRKFIKQHTVEVGKPLKKGERVVVNCEIDVPITVVQALQGNLGSIGTGRSGNIISPG